MLDRTGGVWPPDYVSVYSWRQQQLLRIRASKALRLGALEYYRTHPVEFIEHWCDTYDPRGAGQGKLTRLPFILFPRQREFIQFLLDCLRTDTNGLVEKSRDVGATWTAVAFSIWLWLFWPGVSVGWGSRKAQLVDRIGDVDSIFEKIRMMLEGIPEDFLPQKFDCSYMKVINHSGGGASITGESGDEIGRGGRKRIYFKDESAHYDRPEKIEAALGDNTNVQIDISSVNGLGNVFHRRRESGFDWVPGIVMKRGRTAVFVFDWKDHPGKDMEWYRAREQKARDDGLLHVFRQEVDRNYAASVEGVIIPAEWVTAAIDAHKTIKGMDEGTWAAALDVADGGNDSNALAKRKGVVLKAIDEWGAIDTGETARRAVEFCRKEAPIQMQYDCIGVGSGVKAETNRLITDKLMPKNMRWLPWDAGSAPLDPEGRVVPKDNDSPLNKDFYGNLKAQGWWALRRRFEKTYRAINEGIKFNVDELISIDSSIPKLRQLQKELSQPTASKSARLKLIVDKTPDGTRSPNIGDAVMMCYHPVAPTKNFDTSLSWVG
jgi:phage terminase large subunit